jgi:hypothetical protein
MDWRAKAVVQALLAVSPGGEAANDLLQRTLGKRKASHLERRVKGKVTEVRAMLGALGACGFTMQGKDVLELGTGWSPMAALYLASLGARVTTVDLRRHLKSTATVRTIIRQLRPFVLEDGALTPAQHAALRGFVHGSDRIEDLLAVFGITYLAPVPDSAVASMPAESFDLLYTIAVLEHVPPAELETILDGQQHVLRPGGRAYHDIGLGDHFTGVDSSITFANFLQFDGWMWRCLGENRFAYHNRLRRSDFSRLFASRGFSEEWSEGRIDARSQEQLVTGELKPAQRYAGYAIDDLATWRLAVVLRRGGEAQTNACAA